MKKQVGGYELIKVVGKGGLGVVYQAYQKSLDRHVALKLLVRMEEDAQQRLDGSRRLRDEAQAAAKVRHPGLVQIFDTGEDEELGPYIVYEYLPNGTLRQYLKEHKAIGFKRAFNLFGRSLLGGLHALHCSGIVHRDVKPENLLSDGAGSYKLGDLGLAHFEDRAAKTKTGILIGTPGYMAPETYLNENLEYTPAFDIYGAATILVEAALGSHPFAAGSVAERLQKQLQEPLSSQKMSTGGIPLAIAALLASAMSNDPKKRPQSAAKLCEKLEAALVSKSKAQSQTRQEETLRVFKSEQMADTKPVPKTKKKSNKKSAQLHAKSRTLAVVMTLLFVTVLLFVWFKAGNKQKSQQVNTSASTAMDNQIRRLRDDLLKKRQLPTKEETLWLAGFVRQTGIAKRLGLESKLTDSQLAHIYLARFATKKENPLGPLAYFALLRENSVARLGEMGLLFEVEIVPALEKMGYEKDLGALGLELASKYGEYKVWGAYALRLSHSAVEETKAKRNKEISSKTWELINERLKIARELMLKVGWQNYPVANRAKMLDQFFSCSILLASPQVSDDTIVYMKELEAAGGPSVIEGIDLRQGATLWFRGVAAIAFAVNASTKRKESSIRILEKVISRLESVRGNEVLAARYRCYLSLLMLRCVDRAYDSSKTSATRAQNVLKEVRLDKLPRGVIYLIECMQASADTVFNDFDKAKARLDKIRINEIPQEDKWLFHLSVADVARGRNDYDALKHALESAAKLAPHDFLAYVKIKLEALGLERTFFGGKGN